MRSSSCSVQLTRSHNELTGTPILQCARHCSCQLHCGVSPSAAAGSLSAGPPCAVSRCCAGRSGSGAAADSCPRCVRAPPSSRAHLLFPVFTRKRIPLRTTTTSPRVLAISRRLSLIARRFLMIPMKLIAVIPSIQPLVMTGTSNTDDAERIGHRRPRISRRAGCDGIGRSGPRGQVIDATHARHAVLGGGNGSSGC